MPQLSKVRLPKDVQDSLVRTVKDLLVQIKTKEMASDLMLGVFTPTEQLMIAKRLAIMLMVIEGFSYSDINSQTDHEHSN